MSRVEHTSSKEPLKQFYKTTLLNKRGESCDSNYSVKRFMSNSIPQWLAACRVNDFGYISPNN